MRIRTYGVVRGVMLKHPPTRFCMFIRLLTAGTVSTYALYNESVSPATPDDICRQKGS